MPSNGFRLDAYSVPPAVAAQDQVRVQVEPPPAALRLVYSQVLAKLRYRFRASVFQKFIPGPAVLTSI